MNELHIGMRLLDVLDIVNSANIKETFKNKILNFCRLELEAGDSNISNEIELAILNAWLSNSDEIEMPELSHDKYKLIDKFSENTPQGTKIYEEFLSKDNTYYIKCTTLDNENSIVKVSLSHKTSSYIEQIKNGGTEDFLNDNNADGFADSRTIIKTYKNNLNQSAKLITDFNLDGKID